MTRWRLAGVAGALVLLGCAASSVGCRSAVDSFYESLVNAAGGGGAGGTGGTGGLPDECQGDPTKDPSLVREECGVFVDAGTATNGDGTRATPFKTVLAAAKTNRARIFVCTGEYAEAETIVLSNGVSVYGGFAECPSDGDWVWDGQKRAAITGPQNAPAVRVSMGQSHIEAVSITAPPATVAGASSIGLVADSVDLTLIGVDITAGNGAQGAHGLVPEEDAAQGAAADPASASSACFATIVGGSGAVTTCSDGETRGGDGGKGGTVVSVNGEPGGDGAPLPDPNPDEYGLGGKLNGNGTCRVGEPGKDGDPGEAGTGGTSKGTLTINGISGGDGEDGKPGVRGQGGGGGAGSQAGTFCPPAAMPTSGVGASGGGGGAGGCGGKGGGGGKAGGSSIGIVSLSSTFTFSGVSVTTAAGGAGGNGALGKAGGQGGAGAAGGAGSGIGTSKAGCQGGNGGFGGNGGQGGGGRGGHSAGILFKGTAPAVEAGIAFTIGESGGGGLGDPASAGAGDGAPGTKGETVDIAAP